jgi:lipoyl(octanoyl) transferase
MSDALSSEPVFSDLGTARWHSALPSIVVRALGCVPYAACLAAMRQFTDERSPQSADELWLLEHPPIYTLGLAGRREHLLRDTGIELVQTERGGQITYHGPGQAIVYVMVDLRRRNLKVREFVRLLEDALIATLARYNVPGQRKVGAPGVYVLREGELQKIAALGLKIRGGCCYHGVCLNVAMDLAPFESIDPCGYPGLKTLDLASLGVATPIEQVHVDLADALAGALGAKESNHYVG